MMNFLSSGGPMMWVLYLLTLVIIALAIKNYLKLVIKKEQLQPEISHSINAIIFWGFISCVFGIFAHFYGVYQAMQAIARAADISPAIVAMGYSHSLVTILTGMSIFLISSILWFSLKLLEKRTKSIS